METESKFLSQSPRDGETKAQKEETDPVALYTVKTEMGT